MRTATHHDEYSDLLPGYALGALDDEDRLRVDAHLEDCPVCRLELEELEEATGLLAFAAPPALPPARVKAALFARLAALENGEVPPPALARTDAVTSPTPAATPAPPPRRLPTTLGRRARIALAALAAALILSLGWWNVTLQQRNAELAARAEEQALVSRLLNDPRAAHSLSATNDPYLEGGPAGYIYTDPNSNVALMLTYYLPPLSPDKVYQLWLVYPDGSRDNGGLFRPDARGSAQLLIRAPAAFASYIRVGVTTEPAGGSTGPTSPRVIGGNLQ